MADLSEIGLKGLESHAQRTLMAAQGDQLRSSAAKTDFEVQVAKRTQEVAQLAAASLEDPSGTQIDATEKGQKLSSLADPIANVGMIFIKAGLPEQGADYIDKASEIRRREVQNVTDEVTNQKNRLETMSKGAELVGQWLGQARNQAEWDYGLDQLEQTLPEETAKFREMNGGRFSPDVAGFFREKAISVKDQARLDMDMLEEEGRRTRHLASIANEDERISLQRQRDADLNNYRDRLIKASGGKTAAAVAPNSDAVKEARSSLISGKYFEAPAKNKTNQELEEAAVYVANETNKLLRDIPGLDRNAAVQRAIMRADAKGKFKPAKSEDEPASFNRYSGDIGKTAEMPAVLPAKGQKLGKGLWYTLPDGSVGQFDGKDFVVP